MYASNLYNPMAEKVVLSDMVAAREFDVEYPNAGRAAT
jgi:hypothetical protein